MKRAAIVGVLSCAALLAAACTNDFDSLFVNQGENDKSDSGKPDPDIENDQTTSKPVKPPKSCGAPTTCAIKESPGDSKLTRSCNGCDCECAALTCSSSGKGSGADDCTLSCSGGSSCTPVCDALSCTIVVEASSSNATCSAVKGCSLQCTKGATCDLNCEDSGSCTAACDEGSSCRVTCPDGDCNVTCDGKPAEPCPDGTHVCGQGCKG